MNCSDIATDIGGSATLVRHRIDALTDAFAVWPCHRERGLRPHLRAQEKVYLADPVLARLTRHPQACPEVLAVPTGMLAWLMGG